MASNKNMIITERGLSTLSRELLNKRKFQEKLITKIGNPTVTDGMAFSIDDENFFKYSALTFTSTDKVSINFKGIYVEENEADKGQVLWSLTGTMGEVLSLVMFKDKVSLFKNKDNLGDIIKDTFLSSRAINIKVTLDKNSYTVAYTHDSKYNIVSGQLFDSINFENYTNVLLGSNPPFEHWLGNIDLNDFIIYKNKEDYYSPSTEAAFHFTKILISNGSLPLTDLSTPIINSVYEFEVAEIKRTGNNLLLLARIDSDVYLNIKEVGLYSYTAEGPMLFSKVTGLSIKKQKDLGYGLLFNVNMKLGVVNTIALPEIIVHKQENTNQKDFIDVKKVHTYIDVDMERIIEMNSLALGYGRAQKIEDNYAKLNSWANDSNNTQNFLKNNENVQNFLKVNDKVRMSEERTFNIDKIKIKGDLSVTEEGVASNFSNSNYAVVENIDSDDSNWKYSVNFKLDQTGTPQTILEAYGRTIIDPLFIDVDYENNCFIQLGKREEISIFDNNLNMSITGIRKSSKDSEKLSLKAISYYAWQNSNKAKYTNSHIVPIGKVYNKKGMLKDFSEDNYAVSPIKWNLGNSFNFSVTFSKDINPIENEQTLFSADKDFTLQISMNKERKLVYRIGDGTKWATSSPIIGRNIIPSDEEQTIVLTFDGATYKAEYQEGINSTLDGIFESTSIIPEFTGIFGQGINHTNPWAGFINLLGTKLYYGKGDTWTAAVSTEYLYTKEIDPNTSSTIYDIEGQVCNSLSITKSTNGVLFREFLLKAFKEVDYYISAEYKNGIYKVYIKEGKLAERLIFEKESDERINPVSEVFVGIDKDTSNPIEGVMYLKALDVITGDKDYSPVDKVFKEKRLTDYFYITEYPYSSFKAVNLKDPENSDIYVLEGSLLGSKDNINFGNSKGFSLCVKMFLKDGEDRVILAKIDKDGTRYFVLEYKDKALTFVLYQREGRVILNKQYELTSFRQITDYPVTIFITYNGDPYKSVVKMYKNNELLDEFTEPMLGFLDAKDFVITNYLDFNEPSERNDVINIISFEGELSSTEIFLINNLLDTNF